ncbi:MAG: TetR family transcriptional regulator [Candidatus Sumerlaeia bacterium]|nr:TetR family transcriptional regulator [Candidatus Sumerlaeia bacterium]
MAAVSLDAIFAAAEAAVCECGAANMTLDGVAERAGVSKGGLMYHFPTKTALLQGMVGRVIEQVDALRQATRAEFGDTQPTELMVEIRLLEKLNAMASPPTTALLAAIANQPDLLEPFREEFERRIARRVHSDANPARARTLFLAALGLHLSGLIHMPLLGDRERVEAFEHLMRLASNPDERL